MEQGLLFEVRKQATRKEYVSAPKGYRGFAAFHKYWGKKPIECLSYLIEALTLEKEIVLDPFIGSGLVAREAYDLNRRFIGIDINPVAVQLSKLAINPPDIADFLEAFSQMKASVKPAIDASYSRDTREIGSHFLWDGDKLKSIWYKEGKGRREFRPTAHDVELIRKYANYRPQYIRDMRFFTNSRINASPQMTVLDLFTGRALRNIDLLLEYIKNQKSNVRDALLLTVTAASGQMSKMVFAVSNRGKTTGKIQEGISVGSWVIGYWRPKLHFEINVWNCFENRAKRLIKALSTIEHGAAVEFSSNCNDVIQSKVSVALVRENARRILTTLPSDSVSLILTDPPHSDRMPYLELSELWNAILGEEAPFEDEIVVSNARERKKGKDNYTKEMGKFFIDAIRVLKNGGIMAIIFNASDSESWEYLRELQMKTNLIKFRGCFPMIYSASSVIQDTRNGAMKYDYVLIYEKCAQDYISMNRWENLNGLEGWTTSLPEQVL
jgi:16S rRNA G966 N2-methylase RsmD